MLDKYITLDEPIPGDETDQRRILQDYTEYLRVHPDTQTVETDPQYAYPETHNFYAYMSLAGYVASQYYPTMLLNGISDPMDFTPEKYPRLIIPSAVAINAILNTLN